MGHDFHKNAWGVILGGSSGFGLATAQKLARHGMSIMVLHRDRRGSMSKIKPEFDKIRALGVALHTFNVDALDAQVRTETLGHIAQALGPSGRIRLLLHSIAFGNLKLAAPEQPVVATAVPALALALNIAPSVLQGQVDALFAQGEHALEGLATAPDYSSHAYLNEEDLARTIHSMGTSLLGWVQAIHHLGLFADDARVIGLTSEGNTIAWKGYAAVAAAKVALESIARAIAVEFAPRGIRCNVVQAGVTDTPALRAIPGSAHLKAAARARNPMGRLTTPPDVADVIYLLCTDEAAWINGALIRADGGEHVSGVKT